VINPFGIAVTALIHRVSGTAHACDQIAGLLPGMTGLTATVQQQHRRALFAVNVANQRVARGALEHGRSRGDRARHACTRRNSRTPALNTLSPTASMWSRPGIGSARAFGMAAASSSAEPAMGSLVPIAISVGVWIDAACSRVNTCREPRMQAASARRSE